MPGCKKIKGLPAKGNLSEQAINAIWTANARDSHLGIESTGSSMLNTPEPSVLAEPSKTAFQKEVERAIYGDTTGHPKPGTAEYFKAAENYAIHGESFQDFPADYQLYADTVVKTEVAGDGTPSTSNQAGGPPADDRRGRKPLYERKPSTVAVVKPDTPNVTVTAAPNITSQASAVGSVAALNQGFANLNYTNPAAAQPTAYMEQQQPAYGNMATDIPDFQQYARLQAGQLNSGLATLLPGALPPTEQLLFPNTFDLQHQYNWQQMQMVLQQRQFQELHLQRQQFQQQELQRQQMQQQQLQQQQLQRQQQQQFQQLQIQRQQEYIQQQHLRLQQLQQQLLPNNIQRQMRGIFGGATANRSVSMPAEGVAAGQSVGINMPDEADIVEPFSTRSAMYTDTAQDDTSDATIEPATEASSSGTTETESSTATE